MKLYTFNNLFDPPAAFVALSVGVAYSTETLEVQALIDTGSELTFISQSILSQLSVALGDHVTVGSATGISRFPSGLARLSINGLTPIDMEVVGFDFEEYAILGRDFLNQFKITLDGPNKLFSIE